jgi:hypothetical protein
MDIDGQLEKIYNTAQSGTSDGKVCRDVLLSLWDDGTSHGCDLREVLSLDRDHYSAVTKLLDNFYNTGQQLDQFMTTRQITVLDEVDYGPADRQANDPNFKVADTFSKVRAPRR